MATSRKSGSADSGFRELKPPLALSLERDKEAERYARGVARPKMRVQRSYMEETHLGGCLENVPGFSAWKAMTHGLGGRIVVPAQSGPSAGLASDLREAARRGSPMTAESLFAEDDAWVRIADTSTLPWRCICHLEISYASGRNAIGTGWLSSADTVITAGHNVFSAAGDGWATGIRVVPGRDSSIAPFGETYAARIDALAGWADSNGKAHDRDVGVIKLADTSMGHRTGWFGYAVFTDRDLLNAPLIHSAGYPGVSKPFATQWFDGGRVTNYTQAFIEYRIDTEEGQSGSPIFFCNAERQRWVVATHVYGQPNGNLGRRVSNEVFNAIAAWSR